MTDTIQARALTELELRMLDIGAPVIVPCRTLAGDIVEVRLQTGNLGQDMSSSPAQDDAAEPAGRHVGGCWEAHGAYVAIMPGGVDYGR